MRAVVIDLTAFRTAGAEQRADLVRELIGSQSGYCGTPGESLEMDIARSAIALSAVCEKFTAGTMNATAAVGAVRTIRDDLKKHAIRAYDLAERLARTKEKAKKFKKQARRK